MARAHASRLAEAELAPLLERLSEHLAYCYVETPADSRWTRYDAAGSLADAVRGRAFGPRCDFHFRREGGEFAVTILSDLPAPPPGAAASLDLAEFEADEVTYLLWGERPAGASAWTERGWRQQWRYPVEGAPRRVGVRALEYRDRQSGELQFVRYLALAPVEGGA
jgi:hypothetical protein